MLDLIEGLADIGRIDGATKDSIQGLVKEGTTFSNFSLFGNEWYINGDGVNRGGQAIYQQIGLQAPDIVQKELIDQDKDTVAISEEKLADYTGDYISLDLSNGGSLDENSPVWSSLDAVKNNECLSLMGNDSGLTFLSPWRHKFRRLQT